MAAARTVLLLHSSAGHYGADRQLGLIACGLDPERYRPLVVLAQDGPLAAELTAAGVETHVRPLAVLRRASMSPGGLARTTARLAVDAGSLGRLVRRRDVALVHTNTSVTLSGAAAAAVARVPHVWHVREIYAGFDRYWRPYRSLLGRAAALVCVSEATRAQFAEGRSQARARVVYDGVVTGGIANVDRSAARAALGLADDDFACLVAGRVSDWKGQDLLVAALAQPQLADSGAVALIAGDAWPGQERQLEHVTAQGRTLGVADRVRMLGFRDDVAVLYRAADLVVVPSLRPDPLPNSALEAAAAGACVVAAGHGGLPEIVRDGQTGRLFAPGDAGSLASVLAALAEAPEERARLGAAAAPDVAARFAPERLCDALQTLYDELLRDR